MIGQGGYARVYRARQVDLGRDVAIKVLRTDARGAKKQEEAARRFEREVKVISQLKDPHTITVYDYGRTESGSLYMIAEFIDGQTLHEFIFYNKALDPARATTMMLGVLYSLQEAHSHGILHRDIKPANVMVFSLPGRPDQVKLLDFGIAKAFESDANTSESMSDALTARGRVVGSPGYMSPEQIRGDELTPGTDLYSLGLIFYELLTGTRAIDSDDLQAAFRQMDAMPILLPDAANVPAELRAIVEKMVEKDVAARYGSATEVIEALDQWLESIRPVTVTPTPEPTPAPEHPSGASEARRYQILAIAALVVAAIATLAYLSTNL